MQRCHRSHSWYPDQGWILSGRGRLNGCANIPCVPFCTTFSFKFKWLLTRFFLRDAPRISSVFAICCPNKVALLYFFNSKIKTHTHLLATLAASRPEHHTPPWSSVSIKSVTTRYVTTVKTPRNGISHQVRASTSVLGQNSCAQQSDAAVRDSVPAKGLRRELLDQKNIQRSEVNSVIQRD